MPSVDETKGTAMKPLTKVENGVEVEDIRSVQLNEKINDTTYQILHPETDAYQVITDENRRFVSEEEKARWNEAYNLGASSLHYRGEYSSAALYHVYDVVYLNGSAHGEGNSPYLDKGDDGNGRRFFVYVNELAVPDGAGVHASAPQYDAFISNNWININFESYLAEFSKNVQIKRDVESTGYTFALFKYNSSNQYDVVATSNSFLINPVTKTITVDDIVINGSDGTITAKKFIGDLQGNADTATRASETEKYVTYNRDSDGNLVNNTRTEAGAEYVDDAISGLQQQIKKITDGTGGAVLTNKLTISKNGEPLNEGFDGSKAENVNITFTPNEITDLLDNRQKIKDKWLPETLLGAMTYIGTFDPSTGTLSTDLREPAGREFRKGDYAIAIKNGNQDPSGANHASNTSENYYFLVGDWAVYNGDIDGDNTIDAEEWTKIDNTDAVRTVNEQIGDVKTYKGAWVAGNQYYQGDMVEYGNPAAIYVCISTNSATTFSENNFKICGRIYQADDGIELTEGDNTFRHSHKDAETVTVGSENSPAVLAQQQVIPVSVIELHDKYGHIKTNTITYYKMPEDTWRPVAVNGEVKQGPAITTGNLNIRQEERLDRRVSVSFEGDSVEIKHVKNAIGAKTHTSDIVTTPVSTGQIKIGLGAQFNVPSFGWDDTGHIDSYTNTIFELPSDLIQHKHFNVALVDGRSTIRSYTATEYDKLSNADKSRRFVDANEDNTWVIPTSIEKMMLNAEFGATGLYQPGRTDASKMFRAVDESMTIYHGMNYQGNEEILTKYDTVNKRFVQGDSGIHQSTSSVVYSAIAVNRKGIATAGGQILEFGRGSEVDGEWVSDDPSDSLVIGGLFFRNVGPKRDSNGQTV